MSEQSKYLAFISYAHADNNKDGQRWADWLQEQIAEFAIPGRLVGTQGDEGPIPKKMGEIFLDRRELRAGAEFDGVIEKALQDSRCLIVICSPLSAASEYCNREIEYFHSLHGRERILLALIAGDHRPGRADTGIPQVMFGIYEGGVEELPLFVDFRAFDHKLGQKLPGWTNPALLANNRDLQDYSRPLRQGIIDVYERDHRDAHYKILGTLLGVNPATLNREAQDRTVKKQRTKTLVAGTVAALMALLSVTAVLLYLEAKKQRGRAEAERTVAEQRQDEAERQAAIATEALRISDRSRRMIDEAHTDATELAGNLLISLMDQKDGESRPEVNEALQGALGNGREIIDRYFRDAEIRETALRDTGQPAHMKSVVLNSRGRLHFLLGLHLKNREETAAEALVSFEQARRDFAESQKIRATLSEANPERGLYLHNIAVAHDNLGDLHLALAGLRRAEEKSAELAQARTHYQQGLTKSEMLRNFHPAERPENWLHDIALSQARLGELNLKQGDRAAALERFHQAAALAQEVLAQDPENIQWQAELAYFRYSAALVLISQGDDEAALQDLRPARDVLAELESRNLLTTRWKEWLEKTDYCIKGIEQ